MAPSTQLRQAVTLDSLSGLVNIHCASIETKTVQFNSFEMGAIGFGSCLAGVNIASLIKINSFAIKQDKNLSARAKNQQAQV